MRSKFNNRSVESEILDRDDIPVELMTRNLRELDFLNRNTGGHAASLKGIEMLVTSKKKEYHIVDLGCGSGDSMKYMARWAEKKGFRVKLTGIDKNRDAIRILNDNCQDYPGIHGIVSDYRTYLNDIHQVDIIHCSLFCHHLNNHELLIVLKTIYSKTQCGFVINDLKRNMLAYYGAIIMTVLLRGTSLSRHDGPVSVMRGFRRTELEFLLHEAGIKKYMIFNRPVFRFLIIGGRSLNNV